MKIIIDGNEDIVSADDSDCLDDTLTDLTKFLHENGFSILEISLDDNVLDVPKRLAFASETLASFKEMHVSTVPTAELCKSALNEMHSSFAQLGEKMQEAAGHIQAGQNQSAIEILGKILLDWETIQQGLSDIVRLANQDFDSIKIADGSSYNKLSEKARGLLDEIENALKQQDMVTVSDILEYEMAAHMKEWTEILDVVGETITKNQDHTKEE